MALDEAVAALNDAIIQDAAAALGAALFLQPNQMDTLLLFYFLDQSRQLIL